MLKIWHNWANALWCWAMHSTKHPAFCRACLQNLGNFAIPCFSCYLWGHFTILKKNNYDSSLKQIDCSNCSLEYNFIISTNLHLIWISKDGKMKQNVLLPCHQNVCKTWNNNKSIFLYLKWTDMTCSVHTNSRLLAHLCFTLYFVKNNYCEQEKHPKRSVKLDNGICFISKVITLCIEGS